MDQHQFNNLMWSELVNKGQKFLPNQDCVCAKIEGFDLFLICQYHQSVLKNHNKSSDFKTALEKTQ